MSKDNTSTTRNKNVKKTLKNQSFFNNDIFSAMMMMGMINATKNAVYQENKITLNPLIEWHSIETSKSNFIELLKEINPYNKITPVSDLCIDSFRETCRQNLHSHLPKVLFDIVNSYVGLIPHSILNTSIKRGEILSYIHFSNHRISNKIETFSGEFLDGTYFTYSNEVRKFSDLDLWRRKFTFNRSYFPFLPAQ